MFYVFVGEMLTDKQMGMQNTILCAVHKTDDIEEARRIERKTKGCVVRFGSLIGEIYAEGEIISDGEIGLITENQLNKRDVIGLPPTLARVLGSLLGRGIFGLHGTELVRYNIKGCWKSVCHRKLLNPDGTPCNLREQSEETQDAIYNLLCK